MKNNLILNIVSITICLLTFANCIKKPTAEFTSDKTEYSAGETVFLSNTSKNADRFEWTLYDPISYSAFNNWTDKNPSIKISVFQADATYGILLKTYPKRGHKSASYSTTFKVKSTYGYIRIHGLNNNHSFQAQADNESAGYSSSGQLLIKLPIGSRNIYVTDGNQTWNMTINVLDGQYFDWYLS